MPPSSTFLCCAGAALVLTIGPWLGPPAAASGHDGIAKELPAPQEITWAFLDRTCQTTSGDVVACGDFGTFYLGSLASLGCAADASATETPTSYSRPRQDPQATRETLPSTSGGTPPRGWGEKGWDRDKSAAPQMPCEGGSCFGPPGGGSGREPWMAILDWDDQHGWGVGATVVHVAGLPVHLYALDDPALTEILGSTVGDAHVLAQLCAVAEAVDVEGVAPPLAVNLSFGRHSDPFSDATSRPCDPNSLSCQIVELVEHLRGRGIAFVAAAGNHRELQFPAAVAGVAAAGALDLAAFAWSQIAENSWETPSEAAIRMPGNGLCIPFQGSSGEELWPAPPGTSYASALFAGWLAHSIVAGGPLDPLVGEWWPSWSSAKGCWEIAPQADAPCNANANGLISRIFGLAPGCWNGPQTPALEVALPFSPVAGNPLSSLPSFDEWVRSHHPAPEPDPCVPCIDDDGSKALGLRDLRFDVSASAGLDPDHDLKSLYFRLERSFYLLLDEARGDGAALEALEAGDYAALRLTGVPAPLPAEQSSLVYVVCDSSASCYWSSAPAFVTTP